MGRALAVLGAFAVAALVAVGLWLYLSLDYVVKRAIEQRVPEIIGASVALDAVQLSPRDGTGALRDLQIGNPHGFRAPHAATVGRIEIALAPASIVKDVVLVRRIVVANPSITYEPGSAGSNFEAIQRNVERYLGGTGASKGAAEKKLVVDALTISGARVTYAPQVGRGSATIAFELPDIELRNLGQSRGGVTAGELAKIIVDALAVRMAAAMGRSAVQHAPGGALGR